MPWYSNEYLKIREVNKKRMNSGINGSTATASEPQVVREDYGTAVKQTVEQGIENRRLMGNPEPLYNRPTQPEPQLIFSDEDTDDCEITQELDYGGEIQGDTIGSEYSFRDFSVKKLNYGYIVTAGCHKFAIESDERLIKVISEYIKDPSAKEKEWWKTKKV